MNRRDFLAATFGSAMLYSCTAKYHRASDDEVRNAFFHHDGPPLIALLSMIKDYGNSSEHCGILINGDQRVIYDPAGSYDPASQKGWYVPPRKDDIHYGVTDRALDQYQRFHSRLGYYVLRQTVEVSLATANLAIRLSQQKGETVKTQCASSASWVLKQLPGFESLHQTMLPNGLRKQFAQLPNVQNFEIHENDVGQNYQQANLTVGNPNDIAPPQKPDFGRGEPA